MISRITLPAPRRCAVEHGDGTYHTERWTVEMIRKAKQGGAWFAKARHDFANRAAAIEAGVAHD